MNERVPCVNCILLPSCKCKIKEQPGELYMMITILQSCSILQEYLYDDTKAGNQTPTKRRKKLDKIMSYLLGMPTREFERG
jgi:hypothetical protein